MNIYNNNNNSGGVSFVGLLTICFVVLKLIGKITWSCVWVLSPIWISIGLALTFFLITLLLVFFNKK